MNVPDVLGHDVPEDAQKHMKQTSKPPNCGHAKEEEKVDDSMHWVMKRITLKQLI